MKLTFSKLLLLPSLLLCIVGSIIITAPQQASAFEWAPKGYQAKWLEQQMTTESDAFVLTAKFQNVGTKTWEKNKVVFGIYKDPNRVTSPLCTGFDDQQANTFGESVFVDATWLSKYQLGTIQENSVAPGATATFTFRFKKPSDLSGKLYEDFSMAVLDESDGGWKWMPADAPYPKGTGDPLGVAHLWSEFDFSSDNSLPLESCPKQFRQKEISMKITLFDDANKNNIFDSDEAVYYGSATLLFKLKDTGELEKSVSLTNGQCTVSIKPGTYTIEIQGITDRQVPKTSFSVSDKPNLMLQIPLWQKTRMPFDF